MRVRLFPRWSKQLLAPTGVREDFECGVVEIWSFVPASVASYTVQSAASNPFAWEFSNRYHLLYDSKIVTHLLKRVVRVLSEDNIQSYVLLVLLVCGVAAKQVLRNLETSSLLLLQHTVHTVQQVPSLTIGGATRDAERCSCWKHQPSY